MNVSVSQSLKFASARPLLKGKATPGNGHRPYSGTLPPIPDAPTQLQGAPIVPSPSLPKPAAAVLRGLRPRKCGEFLGSSAQWFAPSFFGSPDHRAWLRRATPQARMRRLVRSLLAPASAPTQHEARRSSVRPGPSTDGPSQPPSRRSRTIPHRSSPSLPSHHTRSS